MKSREKILRLGFALRVYLLALLCFFVLQGSWCAIVWAKAVPSNLAHEVVNGWLAKEAKPMGSRLGSEVENVETFTDSNGQPVYYVVSLKPNGFVVVSADDLVEPIVCFSSGGSYDSSDRNPLGALVSRDIPARVNVSRSVHEKFLAGSSTGGLTKQQTRVHKSGEKALGKWTELLGAVGAHSSSAAPVSSISDVRVVPFLQTEWGQDVIVCSIDKACYNYYTPPHSAGSATNYYAGCVATAMAQYMRFWQYPTGGVGTGSFTITVGCDSCYQTANLRGGDGSGGAYNWSQMPLAPDCSTTLTQRKAIGSLVYDAGVAVKMDYEYDGSGAFMSDIPAAMVNTFGYSNAIKGGDETTNIGDGLNGMINPNLDSGNPVILGISDSSSGDGHAVVADGYGYQSSTLYHHLNMGWDGDDDVWYNLPNIDASSIDSSASSFDTVDSVIYNIYISGTGEIISGRVMAADTVTPISGATVTAVMTGGGTYQTTTNTNGIYAIVNVPSNSTYTISVAIPGHSFADQVANTGLSQDGVTTSGNCWAVDFASSSCAAPSAPTDVSASDGTYTGYVRVTWDSVSGATGYEVWRSTSNDSGSASKLGDYTSPFDDGSVTPGATYYYWVKARNTCGTSDFSSSDQGSPSSCVLPSTLTGVSATDGTYSDHIRVTWNLASNAAVYEVWRNTSNNSGSASKLGDYTLPPCDDYGVTEGTTYYYWIKARNSCGTNDFSSSDPGYATTNPKIVSITKCTVTAGSSDTVSISGTMNATADDFNNANVVVTIDSDNMVSPCIKPFPITGNFKKGKFKCSASNASFSLDTKTLKFSFTAKNVDLSGLSCPLTVQIKIGNSIGTADVNESIVNGTKPIPISFLMGIKNSLRVDKPKFTRDKTGNITRVAVSGGFSDENVNDMGLLTNPLNITVGPQTFTIPAGSFKNTKGKFTCSKVDTSNGIAYATFDFNKCTFTLTIKNTDFTADAGTMPFNVEFGGFSGSDDISLP